MQLRGLVVVGLTLGLMGCERAPEPQEEPESEGTGRVERPRPTIGSDYDASAVRRGLSHLGSGQGGPMGHEGTAEAPAATAEVPEGTGAAPAGTTQAPEGTGALGDAARGEYLATVILGCGNCHTPRNEQGSPMADRLLAGNACTDGNPRCRPVPNLTNHPTGLQEYSDAEVRDLVFNGRRPDGTGLAPGMPSARYHNLSEVDQLAVVAFLRTVPGVDNDVPHSPTPPEGPRQPPTPEDISGLPNPTPGSPNYEAAVRGRYLVVNTGACVGCHTPEDENEVHDMTRALAGGHPFSPGRFGMTSPPWPEQILSANLTPHETGLAGWTAEDVARALIEGVEKDGGAVCPPMPSGPHGQYAGLRREDAMDMAYYLLSLPPIANEVADCEPPAADAGTGEGTP